MESTNIIIDSLLSKAIDYGKTSIELAKLRTLSKTSDVISDSFAHMVVLVFALSCLFFLSIGMAIWIGECLGKSYYGFFVVALIYCITGVLIHLFLHKRLKRFAADHFINQVLK